MTEANTRVKIAQQRLARKLVEERSGMETDPQCGCGPTGKTEYHVLLECIRTDRVRSEFGVRCDSLAELFEFGDVQTRCTFVRRCLLVVEEPK